MSTEAVSVTDALKLANTTLSTIPMLVTGEVSELSCKPGYKAVYFTIKDDSSSMPCMMWNNRYASLGFDLKLGQLVDIRGKFSIYPAKGRMQFEAVSLSLTGEGELRRRVNLLYKKLKDEGLFDESRKKALPEYPETIAVVTSPRGAAVHDVLRTLKRRWPLAKVVLAGVPVEGVEAPQYMAKALKTAAQVKPDVILLVRGGGSFEDLMPFNNEELARVIADLDVPVVTGVGHEPDVTIADFAADFRASTPTAAAETVSPDVSLIYSQLEQIGLRSTKYVSAQLSSLALRLESKASRPLFAQPDQLYAQDAYMLDFYSEKLSKALPSSVEKDQLALQVFSQKLPTLIQASINKQLDRCDKQCNALKMMQDKEFSSLNSALQLRAGQLHALSPLAVLSRGYSIAFDESNHVIATCDGVEKGQLVTTKLQDGSITSRIENIVKEDSEK